MALNYTTLFTNRIGNGFYLLNLCNEFRGAAGSGAIATDLVTEWQAFVTTYDGENALLRAALGDSTGRLTTALGGLDDMTSWIATSLSNTIIEMIDAQNQLSKKEISEAMQGLIDFMVADGKTVDANAVTAAATAGTNSGTGTIVLSTKDANGKTLEYCYDETIDVTFTTTTQAKFVGEARAKSLLSYQFPLGSGASKSLTPADAASTSGILTNGTLDAIVANTPTGWTIINGTAGTNILEEASVVFKAGKAVKFVGNGSATPGITQTITGLKSRTPYAVNFWGKVDSTPAAGVITVDLYDGSGIINDEAGNANSFTVDLTAIGTSYVPKGGFFRLPEPVPSTVTLRIRESTALSNTKNFYLDHVQMIAGTQLYSGGPYAAAFVGSVAFSTDDTFSVAVTNDYGGAVQTLFWRCFDMPTKGLVLPSNAAGSENILDSIIA